MIGILITAHCRLGEALIESAEFILNKKPEFLEAVSIDINENAEILRKKIKKGLKKVNNLEGILILTDMFGGTPSNLSYTFLEEGNIEVLSGVNLPILLQAINIRKKNVSEVAKSIEEQGKKSISLASGILKGNKKK